jgi:phosphatidylglycerophosphate synthase
VAQTRKKRRRKHRGTQGGSVTKVSNRRPRTREEAQAQARKNAEARKGAAPTWASAIKRALIMSGILFFLMVVVVKQPVGASAFLCVFMVGLYTPAGYYLERFLYRRRVAKEAAERKARREQGRRSPRR